MTPSKYVDVAKVLLSDDGKVYDYLDQDLTNWVDEAIKSLKSEASPFKFNNRAADQAVPKLLLLLRECVLTHRWTNIAEILSVLVQETSCNLSTVHKVTAEVVYHTEPESDHLLKVFLRELKGRPDVNFLQVVFEYILYLISVERYDEVEQARVLNQRNMDAYKIRHRDRDNDYWDNMINAYVGITHYIEWKKCKMKQIREQQSYEENPLSLGESTLSQTTVMERHAEKAMHYFCGIHRSNEVWDVFLEAQVELFTAYDKREEIMSWIETLVQKQPNNPWIKSYLYTLYNSTQMTQKVALLKDICQKDPSHTLVLELFKHCHDQGEKCVHLLFGFLDYPSNSHSINGWKLLSEILQELSSSEEGLAEISECWQERLWWKDLYFSEFGIQSFRKEILPYVLRSAPYLLDKDEKKLSRVMKFASNRNISARYSSSQ